MPVTQKLPKVDYLFYFNHYGTLGDSSLDKDSFAYFEPRARRIISRLINPDADTLTYAESIALAVCAAAEVIAEESRRGGIAAENTDGYSVTYKTDSKLTKRVLDAASIYLSEGNLLYAGVETC